MRSTLGGPSLACLLVLTGVAGAQTTWHVSSSAVPPGNGTPGSPYASIRFALQQPATVSGDTVLVAPGTYVENVDMLGKDVHLLSSGGAGVTVIDGGGAGSTISASFLESLLCTVEGFEIRGGSGTVGPSGVRTGGGVWVGPTASLKLVNCRIRNNSAVLGAGVAADLGAQELSMEDCVIEDNTALPHAPSSLDGQGAGVWGRVVDDILLRRCTIQRNLGAALGGGLAVIDAKARLFDCTVAENVVQLNVGFNPGRGAGLYAATGGLPTQLELTNCVVRANEAAGSNVVGGGALLVGASGTIRGTVFDSNTSGDVLQFNTFGAGGGLAVLGGAGPIPAPVLVEDCQFLGNACNGAGGGVQCDPGPAAGHTTFRNTVFRQCRGFQGGGLYAEFAAPAGSVVVEDCLFDRNRGLFGTGNQASGAGVFGPAELMRCELRYNFCEGSGGGAYGAKLVECEIHDNEADAGLTFMEARGGGAAFCTLTDCAVYRNRAYTSFGLGNEFGLGAGIASCTALRTVVWGNVASPGAGLPSLGGGVFGSSLTRCAIYGNTADEGAGIYVGSLEHCTVYGNSGPGVDTVQSVHNSIVRANSTQIVLTSNVTYSNVQGGIAGVGNIDAPESFWRTTPGPDGTGRDFHFASVSSPGINSGDPTSPLDPDGSRADMGAYPWDPNWCPIPARYCLPKITSAGCEPRIGASGNPTLTGADDFHVLARRISPGKSGLLFWGLAAQSVPFFGGTHCVDLPVRRTPVQFSGGNLALPCDGAFDYLLTQSQMTAAGLLPGTAVYGQYWFRDSPSTFNVGLTDALWWVTCP